MSKKIARPLRRHAARHLSPRAILLLAAGALSACGGSGSSSESDPDTGTTTGQDAAIDALPGALVVVIDAAPAVTTTDPYAVLRFHAEAATGFECSVDDGEWGPCESPLVIMPRTASDTPLALGPHHVDVRATDGDELGPVERVDWTIATVFEVDDERLVAADRMPMPVADGSWRGIFRINCEFSHGAYDDPIVFPGMVDRAHLHMFYGNADTDHSSTAESLFVSGDATCQGGTLNRSAYWVPSVLAPVYDGNGDVVLDEGGEPTWRVVLSRTGDQDTAHEVFYYSAAVSDLASIQAVPVGLRMIAGDHMATPDAPQAASVARWHCQSWNASDAAGGPFSATIPECAVGDLVRFDVFFPSCWNGVDLDSPNHRSHMAYPVVEAGRFVCPATHPVPLARASYHYAFNVSMRDADRGTMTSRGWRFASDGYTVSASTPGGASLHGDWFNAWHPEVMEALVDGCLRGGLDCHDGNLANGSSLSAPSEGTRLYPAVVAAGLGPSAVH